MLPAPQEIQLLLLIKKDLVISIGREFRTSAVCSVPPQGCEDVGAGWNGHWEELWPCGKYTVAGKIQSTSRVLSSWDGCLDLSWLVCSAGSMAVLHGDMEMPRSYC